MPSGRGASITGALLALVPLAEGRSLATTPAPIVATIEASSSGREVLRAFDGIAETSWCPSSGDKRGELVVRFTRTVRLKSLTVYAGRMDMHHLTDGWFKPTPIEVAVGELTTKVDPRSSGQGPLTIDQLNGKMFDKLTLRLPLVTGPGQRCVAEVDIDLDDGAWYYGLDAVAVAALPATIKEITGAFRDCDIKKIATVARFPLVRQELMVGFAGAEKHLASGRPRHYANAPALAPHCRELVFPAGGEPPVEPRALRSLAPGIVRVEADRSGGVVYWRLAWQGGRWLLSGIDFTSFE